MSGEKLREDFAFDKLRDQINDFVFFKVDCVGQVVLNENGKLLELVQLACIHPRCLATAIAVGKEELPRALDARADLAKLVNLGLPAAAKTLDDAIALADLLAGLKVERLDRHRQRAYAKR